jgi:hypothetical protein
MPTPPLKLDGPATRETLDDLAEDTLALGAEAHGRDGQVHVGLQRTWTNGWAVGAYAKAWWKGDRVIGGGAVEVTKTWR